MHSPKTTTSIKTFKPAHPSRVFKLLGQMSIGFLVMLTFLACHKPRANQTQLSPSSQVLFDETQALEQVKLAPFSLEPKLKLSYEAYAHYGFNTRREDFEIDILDSWEAGVSFAYRAFYKGQKIAEGIESLSSLDSCEKIDPWWDPAETHHEDRCELWISRRDYSHLLANELVYLAIDTQVRGDVILSIKLEREGYFPCQVNGENVYLPAIQAKSQRGDELVILADAKNPLILSITSSYFSWQLRSAQEN